MYESTYEFMHSLPKDNKNNIIDKLKDTDSFMIQTENKENFEISIKELKTISIDKEEFKKLK